MIHLDLACCVTAAPLGEPSVNVLEVAAMFGLGVDERRQVEVLRPMRLTLGPHQVVFITGPSGGGKSTLLRLIEEALRQRRDAQVIRLDRLPQPQDRPLVDLFEPAPLERTLQWLSLAGLSDAFVMLRCPGELSDGQRYRLRLAQAMAQAWHAAHPNVGPTPSHSTDTVDSESLHAGKLLVFLADEFGATLDRQTAMVIARNARKWIRKTPACLIAATTHDDLLEALEPDVLIVKDLGPAAEVIQRQDAPTS